ncbi:hypothetical protein DV515_00007678 [Chloebia gouldiae]|uniref:Uncharacterized protein n=1 Tax=Chloebia gouldiae TaxID=44316 RepID=A0A3L8SH79_CHLGU|nr:hypothetical protein DV515_00007678 [Chloebia gouldiae]
MLASSRWLQRVDGHASNLVSHVSQALTAPEAFSAPIPLLIPRADLVLARPPPEGTEGAAGEEGRVARNGERLLAGHRASRPGAEASSSFEQPRCLPAHIIPRPGTTQDPQSSVSVSFAGVEEKWAHFNREGVQSLASDSLHGNNEKGELGKLQVQLCDRTMNAELSYNL